MPVRSKIKGVMSFVRAIGNDGKDDHPQRPLIRHQNPRLNAPGVAPAPPLLTPPRTTVKPLANEARPRILPGEAAALVEARNSGDNFTEQSLQESTKRNPEHEKVLIERHVVATRARDAAKAPRTPPKTKANAQQASPAAHPPRTTLIPRPIPTHLSTPSLRPANITQPSSLNARLPSLPRIPHRRMTLLSRLGSGGEGHCDLFRLHTPPHTLFAVKTLTTAPTLIPHPLTKQRKPLEAYILQDLLPAHPRLIRLHDYTHRTLQTRLYFEYCPLGDLQELIDRHFKRGVRVPEDFVWHVFRQLAEAVDHLHTAARDHAGKHIPILHRDIKPGNVLLRPSSTEGDDMYPDIVLTDFGCSTPYAPSPAASTACVGSLTYQGPETPLQNSASDIWSLGCTVHALVHGFPAMAKRPTGMAYETWEWDPLSRVVED
ncbi:MAG: hypothetical protein LQ346_008407, partial [Caloplaca aetnensis]